MEESESRTRLLSWFAAYMGGWNASPPNHPGRLRVHWSFTEEDIYLNDEKLAKYLLDTHKNHVEAPLLEEIKNLKAQLWDLTRDKKGV